MKQWVISLLLFSSVGAMAQHDSTQLSKDSAAFNSARTLGQVQVKSKRTFVEVQVDKTILNVQADMLATSGSVFEILQRAPGVSITNDETISLSGKQGVNVFIDGRPSQLSGKDLADYLKALPGITVDKIEIITNPSSRYDAQGNAGIINIRMKKTVIRGANGNISSSYTQGVHGNINAAGMFNYRKNKWNLFANTAARKWRQNTAGSISRIVNSNGAVKAFNNSTTDEDASSSINFTTGADLYLNTRSTMGLLVKGNVYKSALYTPGVTLIQSNYITDSSLSTVNDNGERKQVYNYNLNYKYRDSLGLELNIDADHTSFTDKKIGRVSTVFRDKLNQPYQYRFNDQQVAARILIYSLKADFSKAYKKTGARIEAGIKVNTIRTANDLQAFVQDGSILRNDTGRTNRFEYTENMYAAYCSFTQQKGKWEYQFGLRGEMSGIKGNSTSLTNRVTGYPDTAYFNLFPTAFVRYHPNENHSIGLTAGRRINRPSYQDLNPFEYIFDNYSRERGNPYLLPEFSYNAALDYSYRGALHIAAGCNYTSNTFLSVSTQKGDITEASQYNTGINRRVYLNAGLSWPVTKWWDSYSNISPFYNDYRGNTPAGILRNSSWGMSWYSSHTFSLPQQFKIQLSSWGNVATWEGMYRNSWLGSVDAACSKNLRHDRLNIRLAVTDIFNTQRWKQAVAFGNINFDYLRKWESRTIRIQLALKLGKTNYQKRDRETGAEDANSRIK